MWCVCACAHCPLKKVRVRCVCESFPILSPPHVSLKKGENRIQPKFSVWCFTLPHCTTPVDTTFFSLFLRMVCVSGSWRGSETFRFRRLWCWAQSGKGGLVRGGSFLVRIHFRLSYERFCFGWAQWIFSKQFSSWCSPSRPGAHLSCSNSETKNNQKRRHWMCELIFARHRDTGHLSAKQKHQPIKLSPKQHTKTPPSHVRKFWSVFGCVVKPVVMAIRQGKRHTCQWFTQFCSCSVFVPGVWISCINFVPSSAYFSELRKDGERFANKGSRYQFLTAA